MTNMKIQKNQQRRTVADRVDDFIGVFSPAQAARRKYFRFISQHMLGAYRGAEGGRLRGSWIPGGGSADQDLLTDLQNLRERSRDLVRNDGIASGAIHTIVTNIIGSGIWPQSRLDKERLKINEEYAAKLQSEFEKIWDRWVPYADAGGRMDFYEIEELVEHSRFVNGEALVVPLKITDPKKKRPYNLALQVIESDRLNTPNDLRSNKNIRAGVEIGLYGEPLAYYVRKTHPGDIYYGLSVSANGLDSYIKYEPFDEMGFVKFFHLYHMRRPGQTRGEPFFSPVINLFKDRLDYMEAELVAARVAACFAVFVKKDAAYDQPTITKENDKYVEELSPGMFEHLKPGESIETFNPNRPGGTFGIFMERVLRDISAGLNLPYEILAKDFSRSNYSNTRAALLEARRFFMMQQRFVADKFGQPVFSALLEEAYLNGELPILDFYQNREAYVRSRWITPGWQWVDPEAEVAAAVDAVDNNLSTLAEEAAAQGQDWEEVLEQRARELKKIKELEEKNDIKMTPEKSKDAAPAYVPKKDKTNAPQNTKGQEPAQ